MKNRNQENTVREEILKVLSDEEVTKVSIEEEATRLIEGDEYIDLEHPERGVQQVHANSKINAANVIPRSAIAEKTWSKIIKKLHF